MARTIQETLASGSSSDAPSSSKPVQYVETIEAYNKWAEVSHSDPPQPYTTPILS
jgi:hypothetical protein